MLGRLIKIILVLVVLGFAGLAAYAFLGDLAPRPAAQSRTITLGDG